MTVVNQDSFTLVFVVPSSCRKSGRPPIATHSARLTSGGLGTLVVVFTEGISVRDVVTTSLTSGGLGTLLVVCTVGISVADYVTTSLALLGLGTPPAIGTAELSTGDEVTLFSVIRVSGSCELPESALEISM